MKVVEIVVLLQSVTALWISLISVNNWRTVIKPKTIPKTTLSKNSSIMLYGTLNTWIYIDILYIYIYIQTLKKEIKKNKIVLEYLLK